VCHGGRRTTVAPNKSGLINTAEISWCHIWHTAESNVQNPKREPYKITFDPRQLRYMKQRTLRKVLMGVFIVNVCFRRMSRFRELHVEG